MSQWLTAAITGARQHVDSDTSQRSAYIGKMLQARYHGFVTSDGAFIIYTFLLLCVPFSPDAAFIY